MTMLEVAVVLIVLAITVVSVAVGAKDLTNGQRKWTTLAACAMSFTGGMLAFLSTYH